MKTGGEEGQSWNNCVTKFWPDQISGVVNLALENSNAYFQKNKELKFEVT